MDLQNTAFMTRLWDELEVAVIVVERTSGRILFLNKRVGGDLGRRRESMVGRDYREIFWAEFIPAYERLVRLCSDDHPHTMSYYWGDRGIWEQVSVRIIPWDDISEAILMSITNIDELMRDKVKYEQLAFFDLALQMPNGNKLEQDINELTALSKVTLIYFDITYFEDFVELYGWDVGEQLLMAIRDWIDETEKDGAQLYRVGNGFASLNRDVSIEQTTRRAKEIIARFKQPWTLLVSANPLSLFTTIRLGIIHGKYIKNEMQGIMLRTIRLPKNSEGFVIYDDTTDLIVREELGIRDALINCVHNNMQGFEVYYQPIVEAESQRWAGVEALCRWTMPDGISVAPTRFIPIAEQLGLIKVIDAWVCKTALEYCVSLGLHKRAFFLDINFSPTQKIDDDYIAELVRVLGQSEFPPGKLIMELTENAKMIFDEENLSGLQQLKEQGIVLSLDDFGTGYSTLANLIQVSAFAIKVDKMFVDNIETDTYRQYLLGMLLDIARRLNLQVIVEGVETEGQVDILRDYHIDYFQGYLFARPLPASMLENNVGRFAP